jgi:NTP pyrophosphatase (non-canonical NTP hydrolase)
VSDFTNYQTASAQFAIYPKEHELAYLTMGLCSEAGEVADKVKKAIRDKGGVIDDTIADAISSELGDVLWYITQLATSFGYELSDIAEGNINKLTSRMNRDQIKGSGDNR